MSPLLLPLLALVARGSVQAAAGAPAAREAGKEAGVNSPGPDTRTAAVPVIHLNIDHHGKASVDEYLNMFPQDLLTSNKKVKPIDVRKIEHEDFIDYEIEFVELSEESKEDGSADVAASPAPEHRFTAAGPAGMTLVNFVDLLRRARVRHKAQLSQTLHGDKRKRRRIKLKRDPARAARRGEINDSSNQIDTSQQKKRDQNNFSKAHLLPKSRGLIRARQQLGEQARHVAGRRLSPARPGLVRTARKRIPLAAGRSFPRSSPASRDQLIRLRNFDTMTKLERSTAATERSVLRTTGQSVDDLAGVAMKEEAGNVMEREAGRAVVTQPTSLPVEFTTQPHSAGQHDGQKPGPQINEERNQQVAVAGTTSHPSFTSTFQTEFFTTTIETTTASATTMESSITTTQATESPPTAFPTTTSSIETTTINHSEDSSTVLPLNIAKPSIRSGQLGLGGAQHNNEIAGKLSITGGPQVAVTTSPVPAVTAMMYTSTAGTSAPSPADTSTAGTSAPSPDTSAAPLHGPLLSIFANRPKSGRLQLVPHTTEKFEPFWRRKLIAKPAWSVFSAPALTSTVSSQSQFSIISTSTETSRPLRLLRTDASTADNPLSTQKNEEFSESKSAAKTNAETELKSTTISLPSSSQTTETPESDFEGTTTNPTDPTYPNWMMRIPVTTMSNEYGSSTDKNKMQNEYEFPEVMTVTEASISPDSLPGGQDLQLSESITSLYLHNATISQSLTNNVETTKSPKMDSVNSITLMPLSKLSNNMKNLKMETTTVRPSTENIFTVTPLYITTTSTKPSQPKPNLGSSLRSGESATVGAERTTDAATLLETLYSGQYHEQNPGQYHEVNPGQYHETNPGQYLEPEPFTGPTSARPPAQFHNLERSYTANYEVNDVKVDFDHQDEHKIYNVQAKAGDFIIGEVGRINVNNGQTLEGVRYTALDGEVDPMRISQILERFFGARTS